MWLSTKITGWQCNYLVLVYIRFWALNLTQYWSYAVSSSNFCAKLCANMPWSTWKRLVQKKKVHFSRVNLQNVRGAIRRILACPGLRVRASTTMIPGTILTSNMSVTVGTLAIPGTRIYFAPGVRTRICCQRYTAVFR